MCDYSDTYNVAKGKITDKGTNNDKRRNKNLTSRNNSTFRSCMSKLNDKFTVNAEDLHIVIPTYNLLEYSHNYSMTSRNLWNHYKDELSHDANKNNTADNQ